jgi:uncharacterized protein YbjQ (UPF0145 family)
MILTTTNLIEGSRIVEYKGIVSGIGMNTQKVTMTFSMSKYYKAMQDGVEEVKEQAFQDLKGHADKLSANAVVGIKIDIELTAANTILVSVTGTAVSIVKERA